MRDIWWGAILYVRPNVTECARDNAFIFDAAFHGVRFTGASLTIRENTTIEAIQHRSDEGTYLYKKFGL